MRRLIRKTAAVTAAAVLAASALSACGGGGVSFEGGKREPLTNEEAQAEISALLKQVTVNEVENPQLDIYAEEVSEADALADISTFPVTVKGNGEIDIEIAAATEMSSEAPDDWMNVVAKNFNKEGFQIGGKSVSVSVRKITSGETLTYMVSGGYRPVVYAPSNYAWGEMLSASGVNVITLADRIAGNTAGILIKKEDYDAFKEKYGEATVKSVLEATNNGDLIFAYTNPYTSSTGLNILTAMLKSFDAEAPLSDTAQASLLEYQKSSPPVAYTTGVLRNQAAKGIINAMVMEEQAYVNTPELKGYVYIPAGIRHDHPVYTFDYVSDEEREAAQMFADYCKNEKSQKLADERGFNLHDDYAGEDPGLDGAGYLAAQKVWKQNKNGGKPVIAVFVADISGSMDGLPLNSLKQSLISSSSYIGSDNYIGLVSYSSDVTVNLPIGQFDAKQRAYFSGEVKSLRASGSTATYDAVLVALDMLTKKAAEVPDAKLMLFVLTDGDTNVGYKLDRVTPIVEGMRVPVYSIAYNYSNTGELEELSNTNEAALIKADSDDVVNALRNLFNVVA